MTAKEKIESNDQNDNDSCILEEGDIYFFYRPKKNSTEVKDIDDVRRFFMITSVNKQYDRASYKIKKTQKQFYRLFVIGKKSLPEVRQSEARSSERYWARVGGIFDKLDNITNELFADEFRKGDGARPVGAGKYIIARHQSHAELAYVLITPQEPGDAQDELGIEKEASFIISVINPKNPAPEGFPSSEEPPKYPEKVLEEFNKKENFVSLESDTHLIDYQNSQVILIGAREGKNVIKSDLGIDIDEEIRQKESDIIRKLKLENQNVPIKPLMEGKLE